MLIAPGRVMFLGFLQGNRSEEITIPNMFAMRTTSASTLMPKLSVRQSWQMLSLQNFT